MTTLTESEKPISPSQGGWEEKLKVILADDYNSTYISMRLKFFIRQNFISKEQLEETINNLSKKADKEIDERLKMQKKEIEEMIEEMKLEEKSKPGKEPMTVEINWGNPIYNQALFDLLAKIKGE